MKRDCLCGDMWAAHRHWCECHAPGCDCTMYEPKPGRRRLLIRRNRAETLRLFRKDPQ